MKNKKSIFTCILAGLISCSYCMTADASRYVDAGGLKKGILKDYNGWYNIYDYNTNDDGVINVLDLCRTKSTLLERHQRVTQSVTIGCSYPWISGDKSTITFPVNIKGNTEGISALTFTVLCDGWYFTLDNAYSSSGQVTIAKSDNYVQYSTYDGRNFTGEGDFIYLVFKTAPAVPEKGYDFDIVEISGTVWDNGQVREFESGECNSDAQTMFVFSRTDEQKPVTTVTRVPDVTTTVTTTVQVPVTTVTTQEPWQPPVTTTTTVTTVPPVQQPEYEINDEQRWFLEEINKFRASNGKSPVTMAAKACKSAQERAQMLSVSFTDEKLPDGRNYKWALYDNDVIPYCIVQNIDNTSITREQALEKLISRTRPMLLDDTMYDRIGVGHYIDGGGNHFWAMFIYG